MAATPKKKLSQYQRELAKSRAQRRSPANIYLVIYNLVAAFGWSTVLFLLVKQLLTGNTGISLKGLVGQQSVQDVLEARARRGYSEFGHVVKWVQTFAVLEIVHSALGLVRSGLFTTVAQLFSRILVVWYICPFYPQVAASPFYISMVFAWSFTEIVRYLHYATGLVHLKNPGLEWLRYSTFYPLYPLGAGSEAVLIYFSATHAGANFGTPAYYGTLAITAIWPLALVYLMSHMHAQRRKHLSAQKLGKKKGSANGAIAPFVEDAATSSGASTGTPKRITRSRSKVNLSS